MHMYTLAGTSVGLESRQEKQAETHEELCVRACVRTGTHEELCVCVCVCVHRNCRLI
jgi:hypothetical protein